MLYLMMTWYMMETLCAFSVAPGTRGGSGEPKLKGNPRMSIFGESGLPSWIISGMFGLERVVGFK